MGREARGAGWIVVLTLACAGLARAEVVITHAAVNCVVAGRFPILHASLEPADEVAQARVYFKARATPHWYYVEMRRDAAPVYKATLPRPLASLAGIDYYIEALGPRLSQGRTRDYSASVVAESVGCPGALPVATTVGSSSGLIVNASQGAPALPQGFSHVGLVSRAAASGVGAGAAGGSGGISSLVWVGVGAAAAAGVVVAAASGGGDETGTASPDGPTSGGGPAPTPTPTPTPAPSVTGRWAGQFVEVPSAVQCSVTSDLVLTLQQSGSNVTGSFQLGIRAATPAPQDPCPVRVGDAFTGQSSGVLNDDRITLQLQITGGPSFLLQGTVSGNRMGGTSPPDSDGPGGSWELVRQ